MITPETTAKTDGPILGSSSILEGNDSLLNNNKSSTRLNATEVKIPSLRKLSNFISLNLKKLYLDKNKSALHDYGKFLKIVKRKNHTISKARKNNFVQHYYKYPYKENPKLIISSYKTEIFDYINEKSNKKYKVDIIGVDEGYIRLPKFQNNEYSRLLNEQDNFENKKIKKNLKFPKIKISKPIINTLKIKKNINDLNKTDDLIIKKGKSKTRKRNFTERERGEEFMSNIGATRDENELLFYQKSNYEKMKENFETLNNYKYEIRKLENWDFEHCLKDKMKRFLSKERVFRYKK